MPDVRAVSNNAAARTKARRGPKRPSHIVERHSHHDWMLRRMLAGSDCICIMASLAVAGLIVGRGDLPKLLGFGVLTLSGWLLVIRAYGLYDRDPKRINCSTIDDIPGLFHSLLLGSVLLWGYFRLLPVRSFGLGELMIFGAAAGVTILVGRALIRSRMRGERRAIMVGQGDGSRALARKLALHPEYGVRLVGLVTGSRAGGAPADDAAMLNGSPPVLGTLADIDDLTVEYGLDRVIVDAQGVDETELIELLRRCRGSGMPASVLPHIFDVMGPSLEIDDVEGMTVLGLNPPVLSRSSRALKRTMDVFGSIVCLLLTSPLLAIIAIAIKLDSRGPVLFVQPRVGRSGKKLRLYKFRTMVSNAEAQRDRLADMSSDPDWLKLDDDPRITRVGKFLRLSSLDELPQLLNVIKGEMSLVGPRPLIESEAERVADWGRARLDLTPGITGLWQVLGRTSIPFEEMVKLDYLYVTNWSLWRDVRLLINTLPAVLTRRGAN